jgi:hypothetical protein
MPHTTTREARPQSYTKQVGDYLMQVSHTVYGAPTRSPQTVCTTEVPPGPASEDALRARKVVAFIKVSFPETSP